MNLRFYSLGIIFFLVSSIASAQSGEYLEIGYAEADITPEIEAWEDSNGDGKFTYGDGSAYDIGERVTRFVDGDIYVGNGKGLAHYVHDPLAARVLVVKDPVNGKKVAMVSLDLYMMQIQDVNYIRSLVAPLGFDGIAIHCTHNHMGPDSLGRSGPHPLQNGINPRWFRKMQQSTAKAIETALNKAVPARVRFLQTKTRHGLHDSRDPIIFHDDLLAMQAVDFDGKVVATLVQWANHVEAILSIGGAKDSPPGMKEKRGHILTAGFPRAVALRGQEVFGGPALFFNGAIGGLMTMLHTFVWEPFQPYSPDTPAEDIPEEYTGKIRDNFRMADLIGNELINKLKREGLDNREFAQNLNVSAATKSFKARIDNDLFKTGFSLGIIGFDKRKYEGDIWTEGFLFSEVSRITIGPAEFACIPGEIVPELAQGLPQDFYAKNGKYFKKPDSHKTGKNFVIPKPIYEMTEAKYKFIFCLTNDSLGYMVTPCDFTLDKDLPWFQHPKGHYEETQSLGKHIAPLVLDSLEELLQK